MKPLRIALALAILALAPAVRAQETQSRRLGSFELGAGNYTPDIDAGLAAPGPYQRTFGYGRRPLFRLGVSWAPFTGFGSLEVGFRVGYMQVSGNGFVNTAAAGQPPVFERSGDKTAFHVVPTAVTVTYRFDWLADRYRIPLAPYGRLALERYNWWVTDGTGGWSMKGATNGWSASGGLALMLDFFDPGRARELDHEMGINHTYLFVDVTQAFVDDFGASNSWDLSGRELMLSGGLLFVF